MTQMSKTIDLGAEFWNDSCDLKELQHAVDQGASGATSNPVIVDAVVASAPERWEPVLDQLIRDVPSRNEDEITWSLIEQLGREAAEILRPVWESTEGEKGRLSMQVNPKFYPNPSDMVEHGRKLSSLAPNIAIKAPATDAGIDALEQMVAVGINVNATVSFSTSQAVAAAEAVERGLKQAKSNGVDSSRMHPVITVMVGRVDDTLKRTVERTGNKIDKAALEWAGVSVFKKAYEVFQEQGFKSKLLAAAYRNDLQWSELIGENVVLTMPYKWWTQFNETSVELQESIRTLTD